jgi:hypothetical protein
MIVPQSLKTKRNKKYFKLCKKKLFFKSYMILLILLIIVFPKFDPWIALFVNLWPKCQNLFPLI